MVYISRPTMCASSFPIPRDQTMAISSSDSINLHQYFWGLLLISLLPFVIHSSSAKPHVYIVYLGMNRTHDPRLTSEYHVQLLSKVFASEEDAKQSMVYSYKHSFSGFSAMLHSSQASALAKRKEVISVFKSKTLPLHTTRSWDFLGLYTLPTVNLNNNIQLTTTTSHSLPIAADIVVGIIDSGIWPESKSFRVEAAGMKPIPSSWKGRCVKGEMFEPEKACNRKLIGARYYVEGFEKKFGPLNSSENPEYRSPRDFLGHGTHTASTAVGSIVDVEEEEDINELLGISFFGLGEGIARGGAPRARLAVYKACWGKNYESKCTEADIMAAFDDALYDGVHVISASFGSTPPLLPFFKSSAAIGSFHASQLGVTVVFSAGNDGPDPGLVTNVAPWSLSVAASSIDRFFITRLLVLDTPANLSLSFMGESFITAPIKAKLADASTYFVNGICRSDNRKNNSKTAEDKVILCFSSVGAVNVEDAREAARNASALALIFVEPTIKLTDIDIIPTLHLSIQQGTKLKHYLASVPKPPVVQIEASKTIIGGKSPAPTVAFFSSRGPSSLAPDILKPDISAPGVNILAAWPPKTPPTLDSGDKRQVRWNFQSGTSMSCPHVSAIVALIKTAHPKWSPAAIRSALMTTAYTKDTSGLHDKVVDGGSMKLSDPFDIGAGHVDPMKAMNPGLVYDMKTSDYVVFLCNIGYTRQQIDAMLLIPCSSCSCSCSHSPAAEDPAAISNMNYPSISVSNLQDSMMTIKRTLRNVDSIAMGNNKYFALYFIQSLVEPHGVEVSITPRILVFTWFNQEITYYVTLKPRRHRSSSSSSSRILIYNFGEIVWSDGFHRVRSPLVVSLA